MLPKYLLFRISALRVVNLSHTGIRALPSSINTLCQLRSLILQNCNELKELSDIGNLCNLQLLDCDNTRLCCLPIGMHKLSNMRLLNMPASDLESSIGQGFFQKFSSLEIINMMGGYLGSTSFDEILSASDLESSLIRSEKGSLQEAGNCITQNYSRRLRLLLNSFCFCDILGVEGSEQFDDPLPNLEHLSLSSDEHALSTTASIQVH
ncbi:probable disease resistance protein At4g27220 [Solanum verrucosum]|uniref:probable disease resistance protein At4g27220 n=1 Tax=Solanum verrucosum TaxID=315347 RepID=UPI0020D140B0|nr:probable disease resistance protein At4g27220 [Solanum verrucosum]